jgi:hypothetical protein
VEAYLTSLAFATESRFELARSTVFDRGVVQAIFVLVGESIAGRIGVYGRTSVMRKLAPAGGHLHEPQ